MQGRPQPDKIGIEYRFAFKDGKEKLFEILLDREKLSWSPASAATLPFWTELKFCKCSQCPLAEGSCPRCPVAVNLVPIVEAFREVMSHEKVTVTVTTEQRTFHKDTDIHCGLTPLVGLAMATSGCPILDYLKPMARFHLPFASIEETLFRTASMYLVSQYLVKLSGKTPEWDLNGLASIYASVNQVNQDFFQRLSSAAEKDANVSALSNLDVFASMALFSLEEAIRGLKPIYQAYL